MCVEPGVEALCNMACVTLSHDTGHISIWGIITIACHTLRNDNTRCSITVLDGGCLDNANK